MIRAETGWSDGGDTKTNTTSGIMEDQNWKDLTSSKNKFNIILTGGFELHAGGAGSKTEQYSKFLMPHGSAIIETNSRIVYKSRRNIVSNVGLAKQNGFIEVQLTLTPTSNGNVRYEVYNKAYVYSKLATSWIHAISIVSMLILEN